MMNKHPLAIAWEEWLASDEGKAAANPDTLPVITSGRQFLENRLKRAFDAGVAAAEKIQTAETAQ